MDSYQRNIQRINSQADTRADVIPNGQLNRTMKQVAVAYANKCMLHGATGHLNNAQRAKVLAARKAAGL